MESRSFFFRGSQEVMEFAQRSCMPRQRAEASPKNKSGWCTQFRQFWKPWFISGKQKHISRKGPEVGISRIDLIEFFPEFLFKTHIPILVRNGQRSASVAAFKKFYQEIQAKCDSLGFGDPWVSNGWWSPSMKWTDDLDLQSFVLVKPSDESWRGRITGIQRDGNVSWSLPFIWSFLKSSWVGTEKHDLKGHRIIARLPQGDVTKLDEPDQDAKFCQAYGKTKDVSRRKEKLGRKWRK